MKVLCINATPRYLEKLLEEGNVYTVLSDAHDVNAYILAEVDHPSYPAFGFLKSRFIPISTIDETEMERNYYEQNVKSF